MSFEVAADSYARFMGRYSDPLAVRFATLVDLRPGQRALDVGCGPGALTAVLVDRLGRDAVVGVDPSAPFVAAVRDRLPGLEVHQAAAEALPFADDRFDLTLAQLVVHFMPDPMAGLAEMRRVTRTGGVVAACVWDHGGSSGPMSTFWRAVHDVDPDGPDESGRPGTREGHLAELFAEAGLSDIASGVITVRVGYDTFDQWWEPYTLGVGPAGHYVVGCDPHRRAQLREHCASLLPAAPFEISASAWCVTARA